MSKRAVIFIALGCIVVGVAAGMLFLRPTLDKIDVNRNKPPEQNDSVPQALTKIYPREDNSKYTVEVEYPELQGIASQNVLDKVNGAIKARVYNQIAAFKAAVAANPPIDGIGVRSSFDGSFDVILLNRSFFSGLMSYSEYSAGAAHPYSYVVGLNYNLQTGEAMTLDKFVKTLGASAGYLERLADYSKDDLLRQFGDSEDTRAFIESGAGPTLENYANFTLDMAGLSIHFDPYQVAAGAAGSPTVEIPYSDLLNEIVKPANPAAAVSSSAEWWLK
jgi:hypothetical protein